MIRQIYGWNSWGPTEHKRFCEIENLPLKSIDAYSIEECDKFLAIFEKAKMVLFK